MDENDIISKIGNQPYGDFNNNTPSQNDKNPLKETDDRIFLAKLMCLGISILGVVMLFVSLFTNQIVQVYISIAYSVTMALTFVSILTTKKLTIFYPVCFVFFFALEIGFMITGGSDGFGILWITIIPIFGVFMLTTPILMILSISMCTVLIIGFWTPIRDYMYHFNQDFMVRFPILFFMDNLFAIVANYRMSLTESRRNSALRELTNLKDNLEQEINSKTYEVRIQQEKNRKFTFEITQALVSAVDAKDPNTSGHSKRVAEYSVMIGKKMGLDKDDLDTLYLTGLVHDLGKIGIPDEIIKREGLYTDEDLLILQKHTIIGANILSNITSIPEIAAGVRWHHERYDGNGYPDQLSGTIIPLFARIIAVADAYDSMTSTRSYRQTLPKETVRAEIENGKGKQFDPVIADFMLKIIDEDKDYLLHE